MLRWRRARAMWRSHSLRPRSPVSVCALRRRVPPLRAFGGRQTPQHTGARSGGASRWRLIARAVWSGGALGGLGQADAGGCGRRARGRSREATHDRSSAGSLSARLGRSGCLRQSRRQRRQPSCERCSARCGDCSGVRRRRAVAARLVSFDAPVRAPPPPQPRHAAARSLVASRARHAARHRTHCSARARSRAIRAPGTDRNLPCEPPSRSDVCGASPAGPGSTAGPTKSRFVKICQSEVS